jgi:hypothetical protein
MFTCPSCREVEDGAGGTQADPVEGGQLGLEPGPAGQPSQAQSVSRRVQPDLKPVLHTGKECFRSVFGPAGQPSQAQSVSRRLQADLKPVLHTGEECFISVSPFLEKICLIYGRARRLTDVHSQDADPYPTSSMRGKAGRNHLNEKITPPPPHWDRRAIQPNHFKFRTCSALSPM